MKKLLFLSSLVLVSSSAIFSCKTAKNSEANSKTKNSEPQSRSKVSDSNSVKRIEHGTVNPEKLDNIKKEKEKAKSE